MKKLLKLLAGLVLVLVAALVLATYLIDPNDYRDEVQDRFRVATGRELVISGDLRLCLFPRPVLEVTQASLPGASGRQGPALAEIRAARFYPRLWSLLAGRPELALAQVEGLRLELIRDEQGRGNWEAGQVPPLPVDVVQAVGPWNSARPSQSPGPFDAMAAEAPPMAAGPIIGRVEVLDAQVIWDDRKSGQRLEFDDLDAWAGPIAPGLPISLQVTGPIRLGDEVGKPAALHVEGDLHAADDWRSLKLEPLLVRLDGFVLEQGLSADLVLRGEVEGDLDARRYSTDRLVLEIQAAGGPLSAGHIQAQVSTGMDLDLGAERLRMTDLEIDSGTLAARGAVSGEALLSAPVFSGDLKVDEFDLRAWSLQSGLPLPRTTGAETFRRVALDAEWRLEDGRLELSDLLLKLDETKLTGEVERLSIDPRRFKFDLAADRLDLDAYLPLTEQASAASREEVSKQPASAVEPTAEPARAGEETAPAPPVTNKPAAISVPTPGPAKSPAVTAEVIGTLDVQGHLRVGELQLAGLHFGDLGLGIRAAGENLAINNQVRRFYQGKVTGNLVLALGGAEPKVTLVQRAEGVESGRLLADLAWGGRVGGRGDMTVDLTATGRDEGALRKSLAGALTAHFPQGVIKDFNLERVIREAKSRLDGEAVPDDLPRHTEFTGLRASAEVQNGVLKNRDLVATTDHLRITGAGVLDLVRERIDYHFEPVFVKPPEGRGVKELEGIPIPVQLTGPLDNPRWRLDLARALDTAAKKKLKELDAAAKSKLEEKAGELLKSLEKRIGTKDLEQGLKDLLRP